ncbi:hypothetical protein RhiirA1_462644 [Rhizophagus irregularis]|uniref:Uncharacterized protein n=1 Tax=Rhizophagus irregularis TaxID=588596 RepID=A0A2N0RLU0_9GLOM|nr:hypothetical protein RhiirA1_462644 [Rhizophagus irregularis]
MGNPFSISTGNYNFIEIYLYNLSKHLKAILNEYQIIDSLLTSNTLFNYPSFIRYLNINKIKPSIDMWLKVNDITLNMDSVSEFKKCINMSLIKLFIENEVNLYTLELDASDTHYNTYTDNILEIILQNPNFISNNIRNLKFSISNCNSMIKNHVTQIINSNQNLKQILFGLSSLSLYQSLLLSKESNCSNTLNTIIFSNIDFKRINNLDKIFEQLNVLESVHIIYCYSLDKIDSLQLLLQKSDDITSLIFSLIENIKQNFNYLSINLSNYKDNEDSNIKLILQNLGQILPSKLEYLNLVLRIKANDIEIFLKNSQDNFFNKLVIENRKQDDINYIDILPYIKEYVMKKKRVKYLAIKNTIQGCVDMKMDLFDLKDEVKEFKLHNIKARGKYGEVVEFDSGRIWVALYPAITTSAVHGANCFTETSV